MKYTENDRTLILENTENFNIEQILECGQCFRFEKLNNMHYKIIAFGKVLYIKQEGTTVILYPCTAEEYESIWRRYFDMDRNYGEIIEILSADPIMRTACAYADGIRLLDQQPYECLISFIISQNNNIPRIKGIISRMSEAYGTSLGEGYAFPTLSQLDKATEEDLFYLRMGFRAKYIRDCLDKLVNKEVDIEKTDELTTDELLGELLKIKGVGRKVADCVMLFSMGRREVFPTDVWVKRVMEYLYFDNSETDIKTIHAFAKDKWGEYAGYAQQYLFYYARTLKIGKERTK